jgi:hypothetical protein
VSRALLLLALIAGCAVPELDRGGAILCGTNNLCPQGFACELGRCCPADAGLSCPALPRACVGSTTGSGCVDATNLYGNCPLRGASVCGALECLPRTSAPTTGFCFLPGDAQAECLPTVPGINPSTLIGNRCWGGKGVCVGVNQLGFDPMGFFGRSVLCLPTCAPPAGQAQSQCGPLAVCQRLSGLTNGVCGPDCRSLGCTTGSTCDRATGTCRQ